MAIIDEAKTALRVSTNNPAITAEIERYISEAVLDLTATADIAEFEVEEADALLKGAVLTYVAIKWNEVKDQNTADRLRATYKDYKARLVMSSKYGTLGGGTNG